MSANITLEELQLAARNHALPLEALRHPVTPMGLHYLLTLPTSRWWIQARRLEISGDVERHLTLGLDELKERPSRTLAVTLECRKQARAPFPARVQPWLLEAVGTAEWTGTPLAPLLDEAASGPGPSRSSSPASTAGFRRGSSTCTSEACLALRRFATRCCWPMPSMARTAPPQHGFPLRLVVPGWYGMTHVKWLQSITAVNEPFQGFQQDVGYHVRQSAEEQGRAVTRILPRSLMVPPGIPDFPARSRFVEPGSCLLEGRAWSGSGPIAKVEVSVDGGGSWADAALEAGVSKFAWHGWSCEWEAHAGEHVLCCRATDSEGETQPLTPDWNYDGYCNNAVQRARGRA